MVPLKGDVVEIVAVHERSAHGQELVGTIVKIRWASKHAFLPAYISTSYSYENGGDGFCLACKVAPVTSRKPAWEI